MPSSHSQWRNEWEKVKISAIGAGHTYSIGTVYHPKTEENVPGNTFTLTNHLKTWIYLWFKSVPSDVCNVIVLGFATSDIILRICDKCDSWVWIATIFVSNTVFWLVISSDKKMKCKIEFNFAFNWCTFRMHHISRISGAIPRTASSLSRAATKANRRVGSWPKLRAESRTASLFFIEFWHWMASFRLIWSCFCLNLFWVRPDSSRRLYAASGSQSVPTPPSCCALIEFLYTDWTRFWIHSRIGFSA